MSGWLVLTIVAIFGACVGSFLNVCIYRLPRHESIAWPGSRCTSCARALSWFDNLPVVSWFALRGRCRTCRVPISIIYPAVEVATALVFVGGYLLYGLTALAGVRILFACALIVLFVTDLQHRILPNAITVPGTLVGVACSLFLPPGWRDSLIGVIAGGGIPFAIAEAYYRIRGEDGLGMGDVKLLAMIGGFLGWQLMLLTLILASFTGAIAGSIVIAFGRGNMKYALPFGTFLALGAVVSTIWGPDIVNWYAGFYA